jgi:uncharacterized alkaline shock family protein YloU
METEKKPSQDMIFGEDDENQSIIKISDEVVLSIAGNSASNVEGVFSMSGSIAGDIAEALGRKSTTKGVKLERDKNKLYLDLYIIVRYGVRIPDLSWKIQESVKNEIESMTGLTVMQVNINIQGVHIENGRDEQGKG